MPDDDVNDNSHQDDDSSSSGPKERNLHYDRQDREWSLSEGKYDKEFDAIKESIKDWGDGTGLDPHGGTGNRDKTNRVHTDWNLSEDSNDQKADRTWGLTKSADWMKISFFAMSKGFHVGSTIGGKHNKGSVHPDGKAADIRTWDKTKQQVEDFIKDAKAAGFNVRDERTRPEGQKEWDGPHLHLSTPKTLRELSASDNLNKDKGGGKTRDKTRESLGWGGELLKININF
jgi:hypothetical protein